MSIACSSEEPPVPPIHAACPQDFRIGILLLAGLIVLALVSSDALAQQNIPIPTPRPAHSPSPVLLMGTTTEAVLQTRPGNGVSLADAIFLGLRNNRSIKSAYINRVVQKFDLRVAEDRFNPKVSIGGGINHQRIGKSSSTTFDISPGVSFTAPTGAIFDFAWVTSGSLGNENRASTTAELRVEQPLLRGAGKEVNFAPVQMAQIGERINKLRLKATIAETIGSIIFAHRDLLMAQEEEALAQNAVRRGQSLADINRALIESGRMAAVEAVQTEANIETQKLRVLRATQAIETARLNLLNLLGLDLETAINAIEQPNPKKIETKLERLIDVALVNRPDYQGQVYVVEQNSLGIVLAKNEQLWDLSLFAQGRLGSTFIDGNAVEGARELTTGLRFNIPLNDLRRQQQLVQADANQKSGELQLVDIRLGIETQIRSTAMNIRIFWEQLAIARKANELAMQAVEIEKIKLNAGRSSTFQVQSMEENLRNTETQLLSARIGYMNALTRLDLQLGTTLDTWRISLND